MDNLRTTKFQRNELLEYLLGQVNADLQPAEAVLLSSYRNKPMQHPLILVMGPLRSGTTLFTQWLGCTGLFAYPSNLLSRFYSAPIIGAKIQLLLTDPHYNFRDELGEFIQQTEFKSENGKTKGILAPNEFWYFWRRFLADPSCDVWSDDELRQRMDTRTMLAELVGMMDVFQKPFAAKGMLFNYNIPFLDSVFSKVLFIQIERDPMTNVASILEARRRQLGTESAWYSFKIPEYPLLKDLDAITQSAGQLHYINKAVKQGMATVNHSRRMVVQYEDFCQNPKLVFEQMVEKLKITDNNSYRGPGHFNVTRGNNISSLSAIEQAISQFNSQ